MPAQNGLTTDQRGQPRPIRNPDIGAYQTQVPAQTATTTTVTSSVNPSVFGQPVTFTATVSPVSPGGGAPTGTVTFEEGGSSIGTGTLTPTPLPGGEGQGGTATFTSSSLTVATHTITAIYGGDRYFNDSTLGDFLQTVNQAGTSTTVSAPANQSVLGQSVTFTATVSAVSPGTGTPTGTVTFMENGLCYPAV